MTKILPYLLELLLQTRNDVTYMTHNSKRASAIWKSVQSPCKQKCRQDCSKEKVMLQLLFYIQSNAHLELIAERYTGTRKSVYTSMSFAQVDPEEETKTMNWAVMGSFAWQYSCLPIFLCLWLSCRNANSCYATSSLLLWYQPLQLQLISELASRVINLNLQMKLKLHWRLN